MASLTGKVAVVTGGSRGIGRAVAERLGRDEASIVVNYVRNADKAGEVVSAIQSGGGSALAVQADVSKLADIHRLFEETVGHFGHLDILVHSAGVFLSKEVSEVTEEDFDATFALQAKGTFFVLQEAARRIRDDGRIINISSSATALIFPGAALYVGSKAAGEQFTKTLAKELGGRGITVNSVSPGYTETDMLPKDPDLREMVAKQSAFGRLGQPVDIADVVAFLASDQARWLTGQNVQAGGGLVM